ncbi:hypothetical protein MRB53_011873 [Persea americana]|uniref:Uncharacterized protein n=1 Tax=Persea americana TaxID=3435 RepID=A0ACC2LW71_PERAE|nr:hypothetical protein MRB53_011873 [Persea americana]
MNALSIGVVTVQSFTGTYGINYGRIADNIPSPEDVDMKDISENEDNATSWVRENVQSFLPETHIRGIAVGNEVLGSGNQELEEVLLGAAKNIYKAIDSLHLTDVIQISTAHSTAVFANSYPPSSCTFNDNVIQYMRPLLQFFSQIGSPFFLNIYPFLAYRDNPRDINVNYALFQSNPGIVDNKTRLHYDNMFDAQIDAAYAALDDAGFKKMEVIISETGWASKGDDDETGATAQNAKIYNYNLRKRLAKRKGTPLRPKIVMKAYIFALFNEDLKPGKTSERNFGLFKADGSIAYDIGFRGLKPSSASSSHLYLRDIQSREHLGKERWHSLVTLCIIHSSINMLKSI